MNIILHYTNNGFFNPKSFIKINLFDNVTVKKWAKTYENNSYNVWVNSYKTTSIHDISMSRIDYWWKLIHHVIKRLVTDYNYNIPFSIDQDFDYDQQTLNKIHRFFTYNYEWADKLCIDPNPFDPKFSLKNHNRQEWMLFISKINTAVHQLEKLTFTEPNRDFINNVYPLEWLCFENQQGSYKERWIGFDQDDIKLNYNYLDLNFENIVTLDQSILGKCLLQSFYENDDPTAEDCTGRLGSSGGFCIDTTDNRKKIYNSHEFKLWLDKYNLKLENMPLEFSIGYVTDSSNDLADFKNMQFNYAEFKR